MRGVVVVDDDEGSQVIGQRETAEDVLADIPASAIALAGVMKPQDCMLSSRKVTKPEPGILNLADKKLVMYGITFTARIDGDQSPPHVRL